MKRLKSATVVREVVNIKMTKREKEIIDQYLAENGILKGFFYKKLALDYIAQTVKVNS